MAGKRYKNPQIRLPEDLGMCLATHQIIEAGMPVGFMYREQPEDVFDSGWRFLSGQETDEYMEQPENSGMYTVEAVLELDPRIKPYLHMPVGTELERAENGKFIPYSED